MKNILWVDDDLMIEKMVLMFKKKYKVENFNITFAYDGVQALEVLKKETFDIILLDLNMPVCSGYDFLKKLDRSVLPKEPEIIVCSSSCAIEDISKTKNMGASDYITKPFDITKVFEKITS